MRDVTARIPPRVRVSCTRIGSPAGLPAESCAEDPGGWALPASAVAVFAPPAGASPSAPPPSLAIGGLGGGAFWLTDGETAAREPAAAAGPFLYPAPGVVAFAEGGAARAYAFAAGALPRAVQPHPALRFPQGFEPDAAVVLGQGAAAARRGRAWFALAPWSGELVRLSVASISLNLGPAGEHLRSEATRTAVVRATGGWRCATDWVISHPFPPVASFFCPGGEVGLCFERGGAAWLSLYGRDFAHARTLDALPLPAPFPDPLAEHGFHLAFAGDAFAWVARLPAAAGRAPAAVVARVALADLGALCA